MCSPSGTEFLLNMVLTTPRSPCPPLCPSLSAAQIANNSVLAMHAAGLNTGLVVDSGAGVTYATPVLHGHALSHATERLNVGGSDVTDLLQRYLNQNGAKVYRLWWPF